MTVSRSTAGDAALAVLRHLDRGQALALLDDLSQVQGNASFVQTLRLVRDAVAGNVDVLLPAGVEQAARAAVNTAYPFAASTDLDRLGEPLVRAGSLAEAAVRTAALAGEHPGNTIFLLSTVAAYHRPRGQDRVLRYHLPKIRLL